MAILTAHFWVIAEKLVLAVNNALRGELPVYSTQVFKILEALCIINILIGMQ